MVMIDLYHDRDRRLLVYRTAEPERVQHYLPAARRINGEFVAVPATLENVQVLRLLDYPVISIMEQDGYDWPIEKGKKPLAHQKLMANFMVTHPRSFNLSDMGCVGGETEIETSEGKVRIAKMNGETVKVRALTNEGPRYVEARVFAKGRDKLYRVSFKSGRSIVVTSRHVFLTCRGWVSCGNLSDDELMPVFDVYPQESTWEPYLSEFLRDDDHLFETASSSRYYSEILSYGGRLLTGEGSVLASSPSRVGVREHDPASSRTDDLDIVCRCTVPFASGRLSKLRCGVQLDRGEMGVFLSEYVAKLGGNQFHISARYHLFRNQRLGVREGQELRISVPVHAASGPPFDTVTHIAYEREDVYYDMHVPVYENYVAHGLCNHNTMKTLATLWAADYLMTKENFRALIVAPLSILQRVWGDAIFANFLGRRTYEIVYGSAEQRLAALGRMADFYIINFDGVGVGAKTRKRFELDGVSKSLCARHFKLAIVDEASAYRDSRTKRHRIARQVFGDRDYLWLLTGTPTSNGPTDAFGLAKLVNNAKGESFSSFHNRTMMRVSQFKWIPRSGANEEARKLLSPAIRYDIKDVWDGPPMTTQQREVALTPEQTKAMAQLKRDLQIVVKSGAPITAVNEAAARTKFIQISLGAVYDGEHKAHGIDAGPRLAELKRVIEEAPGKILCFVPLTSVVNLLYRELKDSVSCEVVNGETSQSDRNRIFSAFQQSEHPRLLIADPGTMAHGLDLWQAQSVVWFGPCDRTELYLQANKRAHRPGQKYPVTVVQLVSNKLEREIFKRLEHNETMQGLLLQMVRENKL